MSGPSEVDPAVLAGEPDSVHQLERGDDDLLPLAPASPDPQEWAAADELLESPPTGLGESPAAP